MAIATIRGRRAEVQGLRELKLTLNGLMEAIGQDASLSPGQKSAVAIRAAAALSQYAGEAAKEIRDAARSNAQAAGWPAAVVRAIFKYNDPNAQKSRNRSSALVGVRKGAPPRADIRSESNPSGIYVEWRAKYAFTAIRLKGRRKGKKVFQSKGTNAAGKKLGMGLATIFERGTLNPTAWTRQAFAPRPAFSPAITSHAGPAMEKLTDGYKDIIEWIVSGRAAK